MPNISKQFVALGTALSTNLFVRARIRLAIFYTAIIAVILILFSQLIYVSFEQSILQTAREYREHYSVREDDEQSFIQQEENQLVTTLLILNGGILIISAGLSYFLAGTTLRPIQKSLLQQKQFLSDASHELRTPLAVMKTHMEVALDAPKKISQSEKKNLLSNLEEVNKMTNLVNELLLLSRLDTQPSARKQTISLQVLLSGIAKRFTPYATHHAVRFSLTLPQEKLSVVGNTDMLTSALSNLVKNAIDYNKKGGKVILSLEKNDGHAEILVKDTGIGIPKDQITFIFQRFYRVEKSRNSSVQGSGLGLSIVQAVLQEHHGKITVSSTEGVGTTMAVTLPLSS